VLNRGHRRTSAQRLEPVGDGRAEATAIDLYGVELPTAADPDALVFTGTTGVPLTPGVLQKAWSRARLKVGRPDLHLHDLRHTGLTETGHVLPQAPWDMHAELRDAQMARNNRHS
jgi:integrase